MDDDRVVSGEDSEEAPPDVVPIRSTRSAIRQAGKLKKTARPNSRTKRRRRKRRKDEGRRRGR